VAVEKSSGYPRRCCPLTVYGAADSGIPPVPLPTCRKTNAQNIYFHHFIKEWHKYSDHKLKTESCLIKETSKVDDDQQKMSTF
jgi:hypothetical protein